MEELDKKVKQVNLVKSIAHFYEENRLATQSTPLTRVERRVVRGDRRGATAYIHARAYKI
jgi:hypothetical protein